MHPKVGNWNYYKGIENCWHHIHPLIGYSVQPGHQWNRGVSFTQYIQCYILMCPNTKIWRKWGVFWNLQHRSRSPPRRYLLDHQLHLSQALCTSSRPIDSPNARVTVGTISHQIKIASLEYSDDAGLVDVNFHESSTRVTKIATGSRNDSAMEISIPKIKAMHIHKKIRVSETTDDYIASLCFENICHDCQRDFPTKRGLAVHRRRWWDGGKTVWSLKCSLADTRVQKQNTP